MACISLLVVGVVVGHAHVIYEERGVVILLLSILWYPYALSFMLQLVTGHNTQHGAQIELFKEMGHAKSWEMR